MASAVRRIVADPDLAIDVGTTNTRVYARGRGVVTDEPSVLLSRPGGDDPRRGGDASRSALVFPVRGGVVVDVPAAAALLDRLVKGARRLGLVRPRALVCTPTDATDGEREALIEATRLAGATVLAVVPEPLAASLGAGLDPASPYARMLVDIGGGVTDIAVIRAGRIISSAAVRSACGELERAVARHVATGHGLVLDPGEAHRLMTEAGVRGGARGETLLTATGTDAHGAMARVRLSDEALRRAMDPMVDRMVERIARVLRDLPHSAACEVIEDGVCLTGGGAYLPGIVERIAAGTRLDVFLAPNPLHAVIAGAARMLGAADPVARPTTARGI